MRRRFPGHSFLEARYVVAPAIAGNQISSTVCARLRLFQLFSPVLTRLCHPFVTRGTRARGAPAKLVRRIETSKTLRHIRQIHEISVPASPNVLRKFS